MKRIREFVRLADRFRATPIVDDDFPGMRNEFDSQLRDLLDRMGRIPEVVALCGSTKFKVQYEEAARRLTLAGKIVLTVGMFGHIELLDMQGQVKHQLDHLHKRKIDLSDRILVLNVGGYIGESTRSEIEYANTIGVPVDYLEPIS